MFHGKIAVVTVSFSSTTKYVCIINDTYSCSYLSMNSYVKWFINVLYWINHSCFLKKSNYKTFYQWKHYKIKSAENGLCSILIFKQSKKIPNDIKSKCQLKNQTKFEIMILWDCIMVIGMMSQEYNSSFFRHISFNSLQ